MEFPWLNKDERADKMVCSWCSCLGTPLPFADKNSPLVLGSSSEGKYTTDGLITHDRSQAHRRVEAAHKTQRVPVDTVTEKMTNEKTAVLKNLFHTAYHVARYKLPFRHYQPLCELQEKNGVHGWVL